MHKNSLFFTIVLLSVIWFSWQTFENNRRRWDFGIVQSKELSNSGTRTLLVKLPETVGVVDVSSEVFSSVKEKDRFCVEYSRNSMTKELKIFSYTVGRNDCQKNN